MRDATSFLFAVSASPTCRNCQNVRRKLPISQISSVKRHTTRNLIIRPIDIQHTRVRLPHPDKLRHPGIKRRIGDITTCDIQNMPGRRRLPSRPIVACGRKDTDFLERTINISVSRSQKASLTPLGLTTGLPRRGAASMPLQSSAYLLTTHHRSTEPHTQPLSPPPPSPTTPSPTRISTKPYYQSSHSLSRKSQTRGTSQRTFLPPSPPLI